MPRPAIRLPREALLILSELSTAAKASSSDDPPAPAATAGSIQGPTRVAAGPGLFEAVFGFPDPREVAEKPLPEKKCVIVATHLDPAAGWKMAEDRPDPCSCRVEMSSRETLVTVVEAVLRQAFQCSNSSGKGGAGQAAPGWAMTFDGRIYKCRGWVPKDEEGGLFARMREELVDESTGRAPSLESMVSKLKPGLSGLVLSEAGSFHFRLDRSSVVKKRDALPAFEIQAFETIFSGKLERDYIAHKMILRADEFRRDNTCYYQRKSAWRRKENVSDDDDAEEEYEPCLPTKPA